jgi:hypothetical protein
MHFSYYPNLRKLTTVDIPAVNEIFQAAFGKSKNREDDHRRIPSIRSEGLFLAEVNLYLWAA